MPSTALSARANSPATANAAMIDSGSSHVLRLARLPEHNTPDDTGNLHVSFGKPDSTADSVGHGSLTSNGTSVDVHYMDGDDLRDDLLGLDPYVDQGCTAMFDRRHCVITDADGNVVLRGDRTPGTPGWYTDLDATSPTGPPIAAVAREV